MLGCTAIYAAVHLILLVAQAFQPVPQYLQGILRPLCSL